MAGESLVPVRWNDNGVLQAVDSTQLPNHLVYVKMQSVENVCAGIKSMKIRGAPLIGVVGAYGLVLATNKIHSSNLVMAKRQLRKYADMLIQTRPTAINLAYAVERVYKVSATAKNVSSLCHLIKTEADKIFNEEVQAAHNIGKYGAPLLHNDDTVLTHCNAGTLATAGYGTALAVVRAAVQQGKHIKVIATETRPLLQGSRLTAYELAHDRIPVKIICDSAAAQIMSQGLIDKIVVGADRILKTGHVTNKIGTLPIALSAKFHHIPFYVAAPVSTLDMITDAANVVIEERDQREVLYVGGKRFAPRNVEAINPAFDITPPELVDGIVTDRGLVQPPLDKGLKSLMRLG